LQGIARFLVTEVGPTSSSLHQSWCICRHRCFHPWT